LVIRVPLGTIVPFKKVSKFIHISEGPAVDNESRAICGGILFGGIRFDSPEGGVELGIWFCGMALPANWLMAEGDKTRGSRDTLVLPTMKLKLARNNKSAAIVRRDRLNLLEAAAVLSSLVLEDIGVLLSPHCHDDPFEPLSPVGVR